MKPGSAGIGAPIPGIARGLPSLIEEAFDEEEREGVPGAGGGTLPSFPSLDCPADLESFALDRPRPTVLPAVDIAGEPCRDEDGRGAFCEFAGSKEDMDVTD